MPQYARLNDAEVHQKMLAPGEIEIWYFKPEAARDSMMGSDWLAEHPQYAPDPLNLSRTHVLLGRIAGPKKTLSDPMMEAERIWQAMQGEVWSPNGEARKLIEGIGLNHTSMSVGDIIVFDDYAAVMADHAGFVLIGYVNNRKA